ncbi:23S rRNA (guanosine(2251)-2'-O)-methyltransferase RlmB [Oceanispirochaeta sp.]|jgi:23S rRNA (guanosine2251-2'-O)-methyltransferase|uniref:23S rRNA (guanosine(2251)-2'-O)-methyltransferase RlmB n=1 Tax=Oceanispirochaeta sp. TaxID=2035350 RepID=UPI00261C24B1|nr:23S rRNA (guanosine(2251)-2'-O)-methyltransferase RlmB [Oceanispirochaeta sp.]MDA3958306.1 23S rRNA (guanosine(2251)-2'-O)-methyltransferase RlmB [Oceanispirochaeta sp.]
MERIISSYHSIMESMKTGDGVLYVCKSNKRIADLETLAQSRNITVSKITPSEMDRKSGADGHKGALFVQILKQASPGSALHYTDLKNFMMEKNGEEQLLVLLLDGITDPHNMGAILRSADQFSVDLVLIPGNRSAGINATVAKVSVGAHAWVPTLQISNSARALETLKENGFWIYGADMGGSTAPETDLKGRTCLVLGSEGKGISRLLKDKCDTMVSIPTTGHVDSLNVSVAAGILMYEVIRQRG